MRYVIVSTISHLLLVDIVDRSVVPLESHRQEYYGISWFPDGHELVLSHSGSDNQALTDIASYALSEVGWISAGERASEAFLSAPHQLLCLGDGRIACTNTGRNAVSIVDLARPGLVQEIRLSPSRWDRLSASEKPGDHLNSVYAKDGRLYVVAHRFDKGSRLAILSLPECNIVDVRDLSRVTGLHNILITDDGREIACHSEAGALIDLRRNQRLWEAGTPIYTRGLAASADHVFIGESQKGMRSSRRHSISGLWIVDRRSWKTHDYLCLGPYGVVHEVRLLDVPDEAHHGHVFRGLDRLLTRDERKTFEAEKLRAAHGIAAMRRFWKSYDIVFGSPEDRGEGVLHAAAGNLCLAIRNDAAAAFSFSYALPELASEGGSHVSIITGYHGGGGDTDMIAFLIQASGKNGVLSLWRQDGASWKQLESLNAALPLRGAVEVATTAGEIIVTVDRRRVASATRESLGIAQCDSGVGIRWVGAEVCPQT